MQTRLQLSWRDETGENVDNSTVPYEILCNCYTMDSLQQVSLRPWSAPVISYEQGVPFLRHILHHTLYTTWNILHSSAYFFQSSLRCSSLGHKGLQLEDDTNKSFNDGPDENMTFTSNLDLRTISRALRDRQFSTSGSF